MNSMLAIEEETQVDDSIQAYKRFAYLPISGTNLNNANPIVIRVENSDNYFRPCDSEIEFEGQVLKADGTVYKKAEAILTLINNGLMYLFDNIKYELSSTEIESVYEPGQATTMFGLLTKNQNYNNGGGLNSCWLPDDDMGEAKDGNSGWETRRKMIFVNNVVAADAEDPNSGSFRFSVKLEDIFGFATDYHRVMYGFVHTLTLIRNVKHNDAMFGAAGATAGKVQFSKISWILPHVEPSQVANYELVKLINEQRTLSIDFRARQCLTTVLPESDTFLWRLGVRTSPEKPRFIVVGFQKDREGSLEKNLGLFDHCDLKNTYILLNNQRYPAMDYNADFLKNRYNKLYREFYQFMQKFYGISESVTSTSVDSIAYKHLFPLIVYDVSRQSERIQQAVVDITIQCYFSKSVPAKTKAYCLMISDRRLKFKSDGTKANIVY
jgi:hypothetical protein